MNAKTLLASLTLAGTIALGGVVASQAFAEPPASGKDGGKMTQDGKKDKKEKKDKETSGGVKVGDTAPAFELTDTDGKTVKLEDYKGKIVVIEWFNPTCPYVVKHHTVNTTFNTLHEEYNSKNVVFLAINSGSAGTQGAGKDANKKAKEDFKMAYPILLDESGTVGKAYGAKHTPDVIIVGTDGKIAYYGGVCNNKDAKKMGDKNYVKMALDEIIAGKPVTETNGGRYGCSVKYAKGS